VSFASADLEHSSPFSSSVSLILSLSSYLLSTPWGLVFRFCFFFLAPVFCFFCGCFLVVVVGDVLGFELVLCVLFSFCCFLLVNRFV
jgi:hypothetical protein